MIYTKVITNDKEWFTTSFQIENNGIPPLSKFYCECGDELTFVKRSITNRIPHFRHNNNSKCNIVKNYGERNTEEHGNYIDIINSKLTSLNLYYVNNINLFKLSKIPDLLLKDENNRIIAVELQNSNRNKSYINEKTTYYTKLGYYTWWIFTDNVDENTEQVLSVPSPSFINENGFKSKIFDCELYSLTKSKPKLNINWTPNVLLHQYSDLNYATISANSLLFTLDFLYSPGNYKNNLKTRNFKMSVPQSDCVKYISDINLIWKAETIKKKIPVFIQTYKEPNNLSSNFIPLFVMRPYEPKGIFIPNDEQLKALSDYIIYPKKHYYNDYCEIKVINNKLVIQ